MAVDPRPSDHIKVEVAFATPPDSPNPIWTNITPYVEMASGITITLGRLDEFAEAQPGNCSMTLNNTDGRFTVGLTTSPYYPNVKIRKKLRVSYTDPNTGVVTYRHTGYVEEWPVEWPNQGQYTVAQILSVDRKKRLGASGNYGSTLEEEYLVDLPSAYYVLGDPTGSLSAADISTKGNGALVVTQIGGGGSVSFGTGTGPPKDGHTAVVFSPIDSLDGQMLSGPMAGRIGDNTTGITLEAAFNVINPSVDQTIARGFSGRLCVLRLVAQGTGVIRADLSFGNSLTGFSNVFDGVTHFAAITESPVIGGNITATLYVDGAQENTLTYTPPAGYVDFVDALDIGGSSDVLFMVPSLFSGTISHVAVYPSVLTAARLLAHRVAGMTAFPNERSDQRIARLASWRGIPVAEERFDVGLSSSLSVVDPTGAGPLSAMQDVVKTENGILFVDGQGNLVFHSRGHRYNASIVMTISATDDTEGAVKFVANDSFLVNDVLASRASGFTFRAVDSASVLDYGVARLDLALLTTSDNEVVDAANWRASKGGPITERIPNLGVDLVTNTAIAAAALAVKVGDMINLVSLPLQAPASNVLLFIEGWTETISVAAWVIMWNTSPASTASVWQLDSAIYSVLNTSTKLAY